jgi:propanediol dehydratase large subunit
MTEHEELEGFVEAWRDDAAARREKAANARLAFAVTEAAAQAAVYDECADELEAFLARRKVDGSVSNEEMVRHGLQLPNSLCHPNIDGGD